MRLLTVFFATAALVLPAAAQAGIGPVAQITIALDDDITRKRDVIGERETRILTESLRSAVESRIGGLSAAGGRLELVIEDARPNRPTATELARRPGLSMIHSFSIGGAEISGVYIAPDGARTPVNYRWYGDDIRQARTYSEWHEAERAFRRFADSLADG